MLCTKRAAEAAVIHLIDFFNVEHELMVYTAWPNSRLQRYVRRFFKTLLIVVSPSAREAADDW